MLGINRIIDSRSYTLLQTRNVPDSRRFRPHTSIQHYLFVFLGILQDNIFSSFFCGFVYPKHDILLACFCRYTCIDKNEQSNTCIWYIFLILQKTNGRFLSVYAVVRISGTCSWYNWLKTVHVLTRAYMYVR